MIGCRVKINYFDQNEDFKLLLPVEGVVSRRCAAKQGADDWYLVDLDMPISYEARAGTASQARTTDAAQVLIRSRWTGFPIAQGKAPSVFLLLVPQGQDVSATAFDVEDFPFVCWAIATVEHAA